jgi:SAM-dependent methyltransferase
VKTEPGKTCYLCGSSVTAAVGATDASPVRRCGQCGFTFTVTVAESAPAQNQLYYQPDRWGHNYFRRRRELESRYRFCLEQIAPFKRTGNLLDVGCSLGFFLDSARRWGFEVAGVEPVPEAAAFARSYFGLQVYGAAIDQMPFPDKQFDVVCLLDVVEHLPDPRRTLGSLRRSLKNDGVLVIQCPNIDSDMARLCGQWWRWLLPSQHLWHFSRHTLDTLLGQAGFNLVSVCTFDDKREFVGNLIDARVRACRVAHPRMGDILLRVGSRLITPFYHAAYPLLRHGRQRHATGGILFGIAVKADVAEP